MIVAAQQMQSAAMKFADVTALQANIAPKEDKPLPDFDRLFGSFIKGFQEQTTSLANNLKTNTANIANTMPQNNLQNQVREMSRTIPSEIKQAKVEAERNTEERNRMQKPADQEPKDKILEVKLPGTSTLDDLKEQLDQLNNTMREMLTHSSELIDTTNKQVRATKRLDSNVALR
jgi:gas vesicle protein